MKKVSLVVMVLLMAALGAKAQYIPPVEEDVKARLAEWQDMKFGMSLGSIKPVRIWITSTMSVPTSISKILSIR